MRMTSTQYRDMAGLSGDARPANGHSAGVASDGGCLLNPGCSLNSPGVSASGVLSFVFPLPPSVNGLYRNRNGGKGQGRFKTRAYQDWLSHARARIAVNFGRIQGPFHFNLSLPEKMRGDVDNRIKPILDLLVSVGAVDDDRHCQSIYARRVPGMTGDLCAVIVTAGISFDASSQRVGGPKPPHGFPSLCHAGAEALPPNIR